MHPVGQTARESSQGGWRRWVRDLYYGAVVGRWNLADGRATQSDRAGFWWHCQSVHDVPFRGKGVVCQLVATGFTIFGIVAADSLAMLLVLAETGELGDRSITRALLIEDMVYRAKFDGFTGTFLVFGVMGGLWIWK